jgi:hypothetical protein
MPVSDHEVAQAIERIAGDLAATLGWDRTQAIAFAEQAASVSAGWWDADPGVYAIKVAEEVQQRLHDTFVDTTWPACPLHPYHPLWLDNERDRPAWRCATAEVEIAPLGALLGTTRF